jgi:DNA-binding MarR family transcriptional regulator
VDQELTVAAVLCLASIGSLRTWEENELCASVTRLVKEFEAEGFVRRRLDPTDNRYTLAALTPDGERVAADLERSHQAYQERLLAGATAQQQEIVLDVLRRVRANVTEQENR